MAFCGLGSRVWGLVKVWGGGTQEAHVSRFRVRVWSMGSGLRVEKEEGDLKKRVEQKGVSRLRVYRFGCRVEEEEELKKRSEEEVRRSLAKPEALTRIRDP